METNDKTRPEFYRAYLLRCWHDGSAWRFSLEPVRAEPQRRGLRDLDELLAFLRAELKQRGAEDVKGET